MLPGSRDHSEDHPRNRGSLFSSFGIAKSVYPLFLSLNSFYFQSEAANHKIDKLSIESIGKESNRACQRDDSVSLCLAQW